MSTTTTIIVIVAVFLYYYVYIGGQNEVKNGEWGKWQSCGPGKCAVGFVLKIESPSIFPDNTGVTGVALLCKDMRSNNGEIVNIASLVGNFGDWKEGLYCPSHGYLNGFQLETGFYSRKEKMDKMSVTNMNGHCISGHNIGQDVTRQTLLQGNGLKSYSSLSKDFHCEPGHAICAIQTQVEIRKYLLNDDSGLNDVRVKCCPIYHRERGPTDEWELIAECDNVNGNTPKICNYTQKIGILSGNTNDREWIRVMAQVRHICVELRRSEITGYNWLSDTQNSRAKEVKSSVRTLPGQRTEVHQVVGTYADVKIRTKTFKKIEFGVGTEPVSIEFVKEESLKEEPVKEEYVSIQTEAPGLIRQVIVFIYTLLLVTAGAFVVIWPTYLSFGNNLADIREARRRRNEVQHVPRAVPLVEN